MPKYKISDHRGPAPDTQLGVRRDCRTGPPQAASALPPPGIFLCSDRHSCGEEGSVPPGKHPWSHPGSCPQLMPGTAHPSHCWDQQCHPPNLPALQGQPRAHTPGQRSPTGPSAIHFHNHWVSHLRNTSSSKLCTARFSKLELWDWEISLAMVAVTEYKCVPFPESNSGTSKGEFLLLWLLTYSPFPLLFFCAVCTTGQSVVEQNDIIQCNVLQ